MAPAGNRRSEVMPKMSKRKRNKIDNRTAKRRVRLSPLFLLGSAIVVLVVLISWRLQSPSISSVTRSVNEANTANPGAVRNNTEFQKLKGRWRRPDGGYVMAIGNINDTGAMDASYFNPYPIHVGNAVASRDGDVTKVFVELRDVNYPGSTYTLSYDPSSDQLQGIYYQAVEQQRFQVSFERMK
jgi:hypothetical protein